MFQIAILCDSLSFLNCIAMWILDRNASSNVLTRFEVRNSIPSKYSRIRMRTETFEVLVSGESQVIEEEAAYQAVSLKVLHRSRAEEDVSFVEQ